MIAQTATNQYLTFNLAGNTFGIPVVRIREVLEFGTITPIPGVPDHMIGVMNVRNSAVPVVDLRMLFNVEISDATQDTCVIILEVRKGEDVVQVGALVDSVFEVITYDDEEIEPPPRIHSGLDSAYLSGIGKKDGKFAVLLEINRILTEEDLGLAQQVGESIDSEET